MALVSIFADLPFSRRVRPPFLRSPLAAGPRPSQESFPLRRDIVRDSASEHLAHLAFQRPMIRRSALLETSQHVVVEWPHADCRHHGILNRMPSN